MFVDIGKPWSATMSARLTVLGTYSLKVSAGTCNVMQASS